LFFVSRIESPPNFSLIAAESSKDTAALAYYAAAGTAQTSLLTASPLRLLAF